MSYPRELTENEKTKIKQRQTEWTEPKNRPGDLFIDSLYGIESTTKVILNIATVYIICYSITIIMIIIYIFINKKEFHINILFLYVWIISPIFFIIYANDYIDKSRINNKKLEILSNLPENATNYDYFLYVRNIDLKKANTIRRYGAAGVVMAFDESGQVC